jgi:hypothetical protein
MKVTKWSTIYGRFAVSEQNAEQTSGEPGSADAGAIAPDSSDARSATAAAQQPGADPAQEAVSLDAPGLVPEQSRADETAAAAAPGSDAVKSDAVKTGAAKAEAPPVRGDVMIMSSGDHGWNGAGEGARAESDQGHGMFGKRRLAALAAVVALAVLAGAVGGALATAGLSHFAGGNAPAAADPALEASVARIDADVVALKASVDHTAKLGLAQFNKTSERLDKVEKAQAEPAAKLAKLSEAVEKLHAAPPPAPAPVAAAAPAAAKEVTGSVSAPAAGPLAPPKLELARLPTVEGWLLRDVANGGALIEGRQGIFEVFAGDPVPGLGRVDAIRRQDGRWVVVTSRGLIVAR